MRSWAPEIVGSILAVETVSEHSTESRHRVGLAPNAHFPPELHVLRDHTCVIRWLPEAPLQTLRLDQVGQCPSQFRTSKLIGSKLQERMISTPHLQYISDRARCCTLSLSGFTYRYTV